MNVHVNFIPCSRLPESKAPPFEVAVWVEASVFVHWMLWPALIVIEDGLKAKPAMETALVAVADWSEVQVTPPPPEVVEVDEVVVVEAVVVVPVVLDEVDVEETVEEVGVVEVD